MKPTHENVLADAMKLPEGERAALIGALIDSMDGSAEKGAQAAWDAEIARRVVELEAGLAKTVSWDDVRRKLRSIVSDRAA